MLILTTFLLSSCAQTPRQLEYTAKPIDRPDLILPKTEELEMRQVDWIIITPENAEEVFTSLKTSDQPISLFALNSDNYTTLSMNMAEILQLVSQQKAVIVAYEDYYIIVDKQVLEHNEELKNKEEDSGNALTNLFK